MFDERGRPGEAGRPVDAGRGAGLERHAGGRRHLRGVRGRARGARDRDQARRRCTASRSSAPPRPSRSRTSTRRSTPGRDERAQDASSRATSTARSRRCRESLAQARHAARCRCAIIRQAVGQITESDVLLAAASGAIIVGFHVRARRARARAGGAREGRDPPLRHHLQGGRGREAGARGPAQARAQGGRARRGRGAPGVQAVEGRARSPAAW